MKNILLRMLLLGAIVSLTAGFTASLRPVGAGELRDFEIHPGESVREIAAALVEAKVIRSAWSFTLYAGLTGSLFDFQAGTHRLSPGVSTPELVEQLLNSPIRDAAVAVTEGSSVYSIDRLLADAGVLPPGALIAWSKAHPDTEGRLFPDTYRFYFDSTPEEVADKFAENFKHKASPLLAPAKDPAYVLTLASILEREVPDPAERRIAVGVFLKRLDAGMPLQVDATICYMKQMRAGEYVPCLPLHPADFKADSPYNTYLYKGLPPGPIGSPGTDAIQAVLAPTPSPYWYYLSDPKTGKTIFSKTFEEHSKNRAKYFGL